MEASARETGLRKRNADDDLQTKGLARLRRDSDDDDDDDDDDGVAVGSDDSGEIDDALLEGLNIDEEGGGGGVLGEGTEDRAALDSQFEAVSRCLVLVLVLMLVVWRWLTSVLRLSSSLFCV